MAFIDDAVQSDSLRRRLRRIDVTERIEEARAFLGLFYDETDADQSQRASRIREVSSSLRRTGRYDHTSQELAFGARLAWRNHGRCIGRLTWKSLEVLDCRAVRHHDDIAEHLSEHMRLAYNGGHIRSIISIFAPFEEGQEPTYIENRQIVQYAGYPRARGGVLGDPHNVAFTRSAIALGWRPPRRKGAFDLLPLVVRTGGRRIVCDLPPGSVPQVDIVHPTCEAIQALGLRWYAVPLVSDMILSIGGMEYPCAPFNGHYMTTEIASRNFADAYRYDLMKPFAEKLGLDFSDPFWRDQVLTEMNRAVLHSFQSSGVSIVDHHQASEQFTTFRQQELARGRIPSGDWAWIVPPQASAACQVFHLDMHDLGDVPNFYRSRTIDGDQLRVSRATEEQSWIERQRDRLTRRWRAYRRRRA